jgi:hypothetical protein
MNVITEAVELVSELEMEMQAIKHGLPGTTPYLAASTLLLLLRVRRRLSRQVERLQAARTAARRADGPTTREIVEAAEGKLGVRHFTGPRTKEK